MRLFQNMDGTFEIHVAIIDARNYTRFYLNGASPRRWDIYDRVEHKLTGPVLKQVGNSPELSAVREKGFQPSSLAVTIFQWYFPSFESKSIDSVSYRLKAVLTLRAVADAAASAATLATAVATAVVMADVRTVTRASRAAEGITSLPPVLSSL